jgi:hypothetical protein
MAAITDRSVMAIISTTYIHAIATICMTDLILAENRNHT